MGLAVSMPRVLDLYNLYFLSNSLVLMTESADDKDLDVQLSAFESSLCKTEDEVWLLDLAIFSSYVFCLNIRAASES